MLHADERLGTGIMTAETNVTELKAHIEKKLAS